MCTHYVNALYLPSYLNEGLAGLLIQLRRDVRPCVCDVIPQHGHVQELLVELLLALVVQRHQVVGQPAVISLILGIQHQEDQIESDGSAKSQHYNR